MNWMDVCRTLVLGMLVAGAAGCASVTPGNHAAELELKRFPTKGGMGNLYVCRESNHLLPNGIRSHVLVNGRSIGLLGPGTFAQAYLTPGAYRVQLKSEGLLVNTEPYVDAQLRDGEVLILWVGVTGNGLGVYTIDNFPTEAAGRACVQWSNYVVEAQQAK